MADIAPADIAVVQIERSGGFAAIRRTRDTTAPDLTDAQRQALAGLLRDPPARSIHGADRFGYRVTIRTATGAERQLDLPEHAVDPALRGLLP